MIRSQRARARGTVGHAYSALNLRLLLAGFGLVACAVLGFLSIRAGMTALGVILLGLAVVAAVDLVVIQRRRAARARQQPGTKPSLFE